MKNELAIEKIALTRVRKKVQSKVDRIRNFLKSQRAGSFTVPPEFNCNKHLGDDATDNNGDDQYGTPSLGDGFQS